MGLPSRNDKAVACEGLSRSLLQWTPTLKSHYGSRNSGASKDGSFCGAGDTRPFRRTSWLGRQARQRGRIVAKARKTKKQVETLTHTEAKRKNIPTAELQSTAQRAEEIAPFAPVVYP